MRQDGIARVGRAPLGVVNDFAIQFPFFGPLGPSSAYSPHRKPASNGRDVLTNSFVWILGNFLFVGPSARLHGNRQGPQQQGAYEDETR